MFVNSKQSYIDRMKAISQGKNFYFSFSNSEVLPPEKQGEFFREIIKRNQKVYGKSPSLIEYENQKKNELVTKLMQTLDGAKKNGVQIGLDSLVTSSGGKNTIIGEGSKEIKARGSNVAYAVVLCNNIVILEPIGQEGNSTFIGEKTDELESNLQKLGRNQVLIEDIMFKVIHDKRAKLGDIEGVTGDPNRLLYDYDSNHLITLLGKAISNPDELMAALKDIKSKQNFSNLSTVLSYMPSTTVDVSSRVRALIQSRGISAKEVISAGQNVTKSNVREDEDPGLEV